MIKVTFLPEDYQAPRLSNSFMKFQEGENRIRILTHPILGWEDWIDNKPVRYRFNNKPTKSFDAKKPFKHFWSFIVWNYNDEQIQILHLTQSTIRNNIESLCKDNDWGSPFFYDIKITKKTEGIKTQYLVNPLPHKQLDPKIIKCFRDRPCNLEAMFENTDPFATEWEHRTIGIFNNENLEANPKNEPNVTKEEIESLKALLSECDPSYQEQLLSTLRKPPLWVNSIEELPASYFERIKKAAMRKRDEFKKRSISSLWLTNE